MGGEGERGGWGGLRVKEGGQRWVERVGWVAGVRAQSGVGGWV